MEIIMIIAFVVIASLIADRRRARAYREYIERIRKIGRGD